MHLRVKLDFSSAEPEIEFILRPELPSTMYTSRGAAMAISLGNLGSVASSIDVDVDVDVKGSNDRQHQSSPRQ